MSDAIQRGTVGAVSVAIGADRGRMFAAKVAAVTAVPWIAVLAGWGAGVNLSAVTLFAALLGVAHVGTTVAFYADGEMLPMLRANPHRYFVAPALAIAGALVFFLVAPAPAVTVGLLGLAWWQVHHFTRQNLGCFAFACRGLGIPGPSSQERRLFDLTSVAGAGGVAVGVSSFTPVPGVDVFAAVGLVALAAAAVWAVVLRPSGWRAAGLVMVVAFYAPLFFIRGNLAVAVAAYGFAHAAQYYLMMAQLRHGRERPAWMTSAVVAGFLLVGLPLWFWNPHRTVDPSWVAWGMYAGLLASHFIIDAGVWKAREPDQRAYMKRRFSFM